MDATGQMAQDMDGGRFDALALALARGADPDAKNEAGIPALSLAARAGEARAVELLLAAGADPHALCNLGQSPLSWAAEHGADACVMVLLPVSDASSQNLWGQSALSLGAGKGLAASTLRALVDATAPGLRCDDGRLALHHAAAKGDVELLRILATKKSVKARAVCGNTPLGLAAREGCVEAIEALLPMSDPGAVDGDGRTPLDWLIKRRAGGDRDGSYGLRVLTLLARVSDPDRMSGSRGSAFEAAAMANDVDAARILAKRSKRSALVRAIACGAHETAYVLARMDSQLTRPGHDDQYPLQAMAKVDNVAWVVTILEAMDAEGLKLDVSRALKDAGTRSKSVIQAWLVAQEEKELLQACSQSASQERQSSKAPRL